MFVCLGTNWNALNKQATTTTKSSQSIMQLFVNRSHCWVCLILYATLFLGLTFLRHFTDLTIGLSKPHYHRKVKLQARADLQIGTFLEYFNGGSLFLQTIIYSSASLHIFFTDASNIGCVFGKKLFGTFTSNQLQYYIFAS